MPKKMPFIRDIRHAILSGHLTAEMSAAAALERIGRWNGKLKAFVHIDAERVLAEARQLDRLAAMGVPKGPLFGVPVGIKDIIDCAGVPTRAGSLTRADVAPAQDDARVVQMLRRAGAIILGKTATVEYAFGGWGTNETLGTPHNPWDLQHLRVPGGSSNGSGVAVAAGLVTGALGSDTGGSIRLPASFCGLVGLKTTAGRIVKTGVLPLCDMLDTIGPMTRCVEDAGLMFAVLSDRSAPAHPVIPSLMGRRIGVARDLGVELHADTRRIYEETQSYLREAGAHLIEVDLPKPLADYTAPCGIFLAVESYARYGQFVEAEPNRLGPAVRRRMLAGKALSAPHFQQALWQREQEKCVIAAMFEGIDALLMPSTAQPAPVVGLHGEDNSPAVFTRFANYFDLAAISLPMGRSAEGMPVGMQIVVPGFREERALDLAQALETAIGGPILCPLAME